MKPAILQHLNEQTQGLSVLDSLSLLSDKFSGALAFSLGFGREGMVLTDMIFRHDLPIRIFTIDTGRLFQETHELFDTVVAKYGKFVEVYFPDHQDVEKLVRSKGPSSFYQSIENRKECCFLRKVKPLRRALQGASVWVTGLRAGQSDYRAQMNRFDWDSQHRVIKFNPLLNWEREEVTAYLKEYRVPVNPLHKKGFGSIGCAPCTRALLPGETERAGRWWWEDSHKECGLHTPDNRASQLTSSAPKVAVPNPIC